MIVKLWKSRLFSSFIEKGFDKAFQKQFMKDWLVLLGFQVEKNIIFVEQDDDTILVYGFLHPGQSTDGITLSGLPFCVSKDWLEWDVSSLYLNVQTSGGIYGHILYTIPAEELESEAANRLTSVTTFSVHRKVFYRRVKDLRSRMFGWKFWKKIPEKSVHLLLTLPVSVVEAVEKHKFDDEKLTFLLENQIPISEWSEEQYFTYPIEWLKEMV